VAAACHMERVIRDGKTLYRQLAKKASAPSGGQ
jgi:hypothetical protein